jgi:DNA (cytosine-5)-methyltransferase 1
MKELSLFTGGGGGVYASKLLGHKIVGYVEFNEYCQKIIKQRIDDGIFDNAPIYGDIREFDGTPYCGTVDLVSGGFPCQDISCAGKGKGLNGERSGLWSEMARIIREVRPLYAFVENSPVLTSRGLDVVLGDLAEMGYNARWGVLGSANAGIGTLRNRLWVVASSVSFGLERNREHQTSGGKLGRSKLWTPKKTSDVLRSFLQRADASDLHGIPNGISARVDRLKASGNAQVPAVAALAWRILTQENDAI